MRRDGAGRAAFPTPRHRARVSRRIVTALALAIVAAGGFDASAGFLVGDFAPASLRPFGFGTEVAGAAPMAVAGVAPEYAQVWAGPWNRWTWKDLEADLAWAQEEDVTLVVEWFYWGDALSPPCFARGCEGRSADEWYDLTRELGRRVAASGASVVVVVESEFNKGGIDSERDAPTFDAGLERVVGILHEEAPWTKVAIGFGAWHREAWSRFPRAVAAADYVGLQAMAASTRQTEEEYRGVPDRLEGNVRYAAATFGKPVLVHDVALGSFGEAGVQDPHWLVVQAQVVRDLVARADALAEAGAVGLVYRGLRDAAQSGHFGDAEGSFGLVTAEGHAKGAWWAWTDGVRTYRNGGR